MESIATRVWLGQRCASAFSELASGRFFQKLWQAGLAEYDGMHGIAWQWQAADGAMGKAPLATECAGRNPTDRRKKRTQAQPAGRRPWAPAVDRRQWRKSSRLQAAGSDAGSGRGPAS